MTPGNADSEQRRWFGARVAACTAAKLGGWFWLPCPVCGEYFGGQEWLTDDELPASVPDPDQRGPVSRDLPLVYSRRLRLAHAGVMGSVGLAAVRYRRFTCD